MDLIPNGCSVADGMGICPASYTFSFASPRGKLEAELVCPIDKLEEAGGYREATQEGLCECNTALIPDFDNKPEEKKPIDCMCYGCPAGSRYGAAYFCNDTIWGDCFGLNCGGGCNGMPDFPYFVEQVLNPPVEVTTAPTTAPVEAVQFSEDSYDGVDGCVTITDDGASTMVVCPADGSFEHGEEDTSTIQATLRCPLDVLEELDGDLAEATYQGLCECDTTLLAVARMDTDAEPLNDSCSCYACPEGSPLDFAYECSASLVAGIDCLKVDCRGKCTDLPFDFIINEGDSVTPNDSEELSEDGADGVKASGTFQNSISKKGVFLFVSMAAMTVFGF